MLQSSKLAKNFRDIAIALTIGHFVYQMLPGKHQWDSAFNSSFDQCVALLVAWFVITRERK